jgi:hypothetical protein
MAFQFFHIFEILSFVCAVVFYKHLKNFNLSGFIPLLFVVCATDLTAANIQAFGLYNNHFIYNYYLIISNIITLYIFLQMLDYTGFIKILYISLSVLLIIFTVLNIYFLQGNVAFDTYSVILIEFFTSILCLLVISKLFTHDNADIPLHEHPYFWISGGTLLFGCCSLIVLGLQQFIQLKRIMIGGKNIYNILMPILNVILYSCYCYAFYLCKRLTNKLLLPS